MAVAKKGLGRGLSALIPGADMDFLSRVARGEHQIQSSADAAAAPAQPESDREPAAERDARGAAEWVKPEEIEPNPFQPRTHFPAEEMQDLVQSIRNHGLLQPVLVRPLDQPREGVRFQLVAGERRWRASREAGLARLPAIVRPVNDQQALELALIENVQRHDISPVDTAHAYRRLTQDFGLSQDEVARRVGKSRSSIANTVRLLDLPEEVRKAMEDGLLTEGHGRAILLAPGDGARRAIFRRILRDRLSVREAEQLARDASRADGEGKTPNARRQMAAARSLAAELRRMEEQLQQTLGTRLRIRPKAKGGRIIIDYFSAEDLERLMGVLGGGQ